MLFSTFTEDGLRDAEIITFKIIRAEHIKPTISSGNIYFGCADYYAYQEENTGNKGQGDKEEGIFARVLKSKVSYIKEQERLHKTDLLKIDNGGDFLDIKLKSVINMPIYCLYTVNASDPSVICSDRPTKSPKVKNRTYEFIVPKKVIQDFSSDVDKFGVMLFSNHTDLYLRIRDALKTKGCSQIVKNRICYVNRENKEWICPEDHPAELFYKDIAFQHQKEGRIVVNDNRLSFANKKDRSKKYRGDINIGDLTDVVKQSAFPSGDMRFEIKLTVTEI